MTMAPNQEWADIQNQEEDLKAMKKTLKWKMVSKDKELEAVEDHEVEEECPPTEEEEVVISDSDLEAE